MRPVYGNQYDEPQSPCCAGRDMVLWFGLYLDYRDGLWEADTESLLEVRRTDGNQSVEMTPWWGTAGGEEQHARVVHLGRRFLPLVLDDELWPLRLCPREKIFADWFLKAMIWCLLLVEPWPGGPWSQTLVYSSSKPAVLVLTIKWNKILMDVSLKCTVYVHEGRLKYVRKRRWIEKGVRQYNWKLYNCHGLKKMVQAAAD